MSDGCRAGNALVARGPRPLVSGGDMRGGGRPSRVRPSARGISSRGRAPGAVAQRKGSRSGGGRAAEPATQRRGPHSGGTDAAAAYSARRIPSRERAQRGFHAAEEIHAAEGRCRPRHPPPAESPPASDGASDSTRRIPSRERRRERLRRRRTGAGAAGDGKNGAPDRIRTCDARVRSAALYPLSYGGGVRPAYCAAIGRSDEEPVTPVSARPPRSPEISPSSHRPGSAGVAWRTSIPSAPTVAAHTRRDSST